MRRSVERGELIHNSETRPQDDRSLPDAIRAVIDDMNDAIVHLDALLEYDHSPLVNRQLRPAAKELSQAGASLGVAAIAADQQMGN